MWNARSNKCDICGERQDLKNRTYDGIKMTVCFSYIRKRAKAKARARKGLRRGFRKIRKQIIESRGKCCEDCGDDTRVVAHHKMRVMDGGKHTPKNIILLCEDCHAKKHNGGTRW